MIIILSMSELRKSIKPTLDGILKTLQETDQATINPQRIVFPKININLKKTKMTSYPSAYRGAKSCFIHSLESENSLANTSINADRKHKECKGKDIEENKDSILSKDRKDHESKVEFNQKVWKLNKKFDQSHSTDVNSGEEVSLSLQNSNFRRKLEKLKRERSEGFLMKSPQTSFQKVRNHSKELQMMSKQKITTETSSFISQIQGYNQQSYPKPRSNRQINQNINQSNKIISLIVKNYEKGFFEQENSSQKDESYKKLQQKLGLFTYLKRKFVIEKQEVTPQKIKDYFKNNSHIDVQRKINEQSRQFLKYKVKNDYHSHKQVEKLKLNLSQNAIKKQIQQKNIDFHKNYSKKYNVPYLSYLSLPKKLKMNVLKKVTALSLIE